MAKQTHLLFAIFLFVILALSACTSVKVTTDEVKEAAISAIAEHDHVKHNEVNIIEIRPHDHKNNAWSVSYQTKDKKYGIWFPVDGWEIVEIKKNSDGKLSGEFYRYDI
ncbi:hypothetical protein [Paenibacillus glycanilyticus]|uniref:Lipoprotein n=1 Tax=Paenibacillus glycanilyticus TaxID=126569 RepID=A0ABQ6G741_9BACL|nr:hypothetical protein [Paenibacillus glycanilyticus]GLX66769.1 hypothetical protein MU1_11130 [Paenibacillus glycanilyticus]